MTEHFGIVGDADELPVTFLAKPRMRVGQAIALCRTSDSDWGCFVSTVPASRCYTVRTSLAVDAFGVVEIHPADQATAENGPPADLGLTADEWEDLGMAVGESIVLADGHTAGIAEEQTPTETRTIPLASLHLVGNPMRRRR